MKTKMSLVIIPPRFGKVEFVSEKLRKMPIGTTQKIHGKVVCKPNLEGPGQGITLSAIVFDDDVIGERE